jgi:hypothetical protein
MRLPRRARSRDELVAALGPVAPCLADMVTRRTGMARLATLPAGHVVHHDAPEQFDGPPQSWSDSSVTIGRSAAPRSRTATSTAESRAAAPQTR